MSLSLPRQAFALSAESFSMISSFKDVPWLNQIKKLSRQFYVQHLNVCAQAGCRSEFLGLASDQPGQIGPSALAQWAWMLSVSSSGLPADSTLTHGTRALLSRDTAGRMFKQMTASLD
jgi:hypothetical protein